MDSIFIARIQFAINAGFHFLFPPTTFGLALMILILESLHLKTGEQLYVKLSNFLVKILGVVFVVGTASGIVLEFAFGTNWSNYARVVGDIFGAPLAAEGVFAFFLESVFLGVLVFGRNKVSKKAYWWSSFFVFLGSHLSALWIIIANSWMQTPAGFKMVNNVARLTNFFQAAVNHSTIIRYIHTIVAGWLTGSLLVAGIAAYYLLKNKFVETIKPLFRISIITIIICSFIQLWLGHFHSIQVALTQPEKMAAYEALWETQAGAPLAIFAIPSEKNEKNYFFIGIPKLLSYLIYFDSTKKVKGLKDFPKDERPPVFLSFSFYHIMILLGVILILISLIGIYLIAIDKLFERKWFFKIILYSIPIPYISNEAGWIAAEVGRQPWAVYKVLKTVDAVSVSVPAGNILFSLIIFTFIYILLFVVTIKVILKIIQKGPDLEKIIY